MGKRVTQSYTQEFPVEAIKLVLEQGMTAAEAATLLNMNQGTLAYWVTQARKGKKLEISAVGQPSVESLTAEVRQLRKELTEARMERDILKKARRTLPGSHCPVRVREAMATLLSGEVAVPGIVDFTRWILCLAETPTLPPRAGE